MPRMTAQQLFWTGVVMLVLGVVCSLASQSMIYDYSVFGIGWFYRFFVVGSGVLVGLGSTLVVGGLVVGAIQRGPVAPRPPYPPQGGYGPLGGYAAQQQPYTGQQQPYAPQPQPYAAQQPAPGQQPYQTPPAPQPPSTPQGYAPPQPSTPTQDPADPQR